MSVKIALDSFSGSGRVFDGTLARAMRGLAQDLASARIQNAQLTDITDSSGGTAGSAISGAVVPTAAYDATSSGGASRSEFNTAIGKFENAGAVLVGVFNTARARLGLPLLTAASGTVATAGTVAALDLSVAAATGTSALDYVSGVAKMKQARSNLMSLAYGLNDILVAVGETPLSITVSGAYALTQALVAIADADASATGASAISKTVADAFLATIANDVALLAATWNNLMLQGELSDLTDSSGGTAATGLAANALPTAADGAATTSSPKVGFDAELVKIENNLCDLTSRMNALRKFYRLSAYTDSTGGTADTTIEALTVALTAVDGSTGTDAVDQVTALARMTTIHSALKSLVVGINAVRAIVGLPAITDSLATGTASTTIANIAATGTGVSGAGATLLDSAVDAWLVINRHNIATVAKALNDITGSGMVTTKPLQVVAV